MGYGKDAVTGFASDYCSKMQSFTDAANALLARDYKGFGKQGMNVVIEGERKDG